MEKNSKNIRKILTIESKEGVDKKYISLFDLDLVVDLHDDKKLAECMIKTSKIAKLTYGNDVLFHLKIEAVKDITGEEI